MALLSSSGCAAYRFGSASMFRPGIRTVHVPVIRNDTFRHDLGVRLTEAVIREIERRTPYKVTGDPNADSTLNCRVIDESKRVLSETATDDPRALDAAIAVQATWISRGGELLMQNSVVPTGNLAISFGQDARFVPEADGEVAGGDHAVLHQQLAAPADPGRLDGDGGVECSRVVRHGFTQNTL